MNVGVDGRALAGHRGTGRYARSLLGALAARYPQDAWHVVMAGGPRADGLPGGVHVHAAAARPRKHYARVALTGRPRLDDVADADLDVAWIPAPAPAALAPQTPYVLTVHDLAWLERPQDFTRYERAWHALSRVRRLAARATRIACDSAATRDALLTRWPEVDPARAQVLSPGVDPPAAHGLPPTGLPDRFLLFVGALEPRKAPDVLARAFARARGRGLGSGLVVVGDGRLAGTLDVPGVHRLTEVDDATLGALYERAVALVMPSLLEGFGLPPLEALAHGTASVVSDLAVFRETLGDGGALFAAPGDDVALADALLRIDGDEALRARLVAAGAPALERHRLPAAADALHALLTEAAAEGPPR